MKSKKLVFVLVIIAVLVAGWMITLKAVSGIDEINEQKKLVEQANIFNGKKLFVRGIPLLEEALNINTEKNVEVKRNLLNAYREHGDVDAYYALLQDLDKDPEHLYGQPGDYLTLAEYYAENGAIQDALLIARTGLEKHEDSDLKEFWEKYRYDCSISNSEYGQIWLTNSGKYYPAYDGRAWNYISNENSKTLQVDAQEVYPFNQDGYGVMKVNNRYYTILSSGELYGLDETGVEEVLGLTSRFIIAKKNGLYGYYDYDFHLLSESLQFEDMTLNSDGATFVKRDGKWAIYNDSGEAVTDFIFEDVRKNSLGYAFAESRAMVRKDGKWMMVNVAGEPLCAETFVDAKAPESGQYIAVANENGKWGFINSKGELIIDYQYADASSFSCDMAAVKVINRWGYISAKNELVIDDDFVEATPFYNGTAIITVTDGTLAFMNQRYFNLDE